MPIVLAIIVVVGAFTVNIKPKEAPPPTPTVVQPTTDDSSPERFNSLATYS